VCQKRESRSAVEAQGNLGTLGAWGGLGAVKGGPKTAPKAALFCHSFTATETYAVKILWFCSLTNSASIKSCLRSSDVATSMCVERRA
jgi:hypothetical protein